MPSFKYSEDIYDIPDEKVQDFIAKMPEATPIVSFKKGEDIYDIPFGKVKDFIDKTPDVKAELSEYDEADFRKWYAKTAKAYKLDEDPDSGKVEYDYRKAFLTGKIPGETVKTIEFDPKKGGIQPEKFIHRNEINVFDELNTLDKQIAALVNNPPNIEKAKRLGLTDIGKKYRAELEGLADKIGDLQVDLTQRLQFKNFPKDKKDTIIDSLNKSRQVLFEQTKRNEVTPETMALWAEAATASNKVIYGDWQIALGRVKEFLGGKIGKKLTNFSPILQAAGVPLQLISRKSGEEWSEILAPSQQVQTTKSIFDLNKATASAGAGLESITESMIGTMLTGGIGTSLKLGKPTLSVLRFAGWATPSGIKTAGMTYDNAIKHLDSSPEFADWTPEQKVHTALLESAINTSVEVLSELIGFEKWGGKALGFKVKFPVLENAKKSLLNTVTKFIKAGVAGTVWEWSQEMLSEFGQNLSAALRNDSRIVDFFKGKIGGEEALNKFIDTSVQNLAGVISTFGFAGVGELTNIRANNINTYLQNPNEALKNFGIDDEEVSRLTKIGISGVFEGKEKRIDYATRVLDKIDSPQAGIAKSLINSAAVVRLESVEEPPPEIRETISEVNLIEGEEVPSEIGEIPMEGMELVEGAFEEKPSVKVEEDLPITPVEEMPEAMEEIVPVEAVIEETMPVEEVPREIEEEAALSEITPAFKPQKIKIEKPVKEVKDLTEKSITDLRKIAKEKKISLRGLTTKNKLIEAIEQKEVPVEKIEKPITAKEAVAKGMSEKAKAEVKPEKVIGEVILKGSFVKPISRFEKRDSGWYQTHAKGKEVFYKIEDEASIKNLEQEIKPEAKAEPVTPKIEPVKKPEMPKKEKEIGKKLWKKKIDEIIKARKKIYDLEIHNNIITKKLNILKKEYQNKLSKAKTKEEKQNIINEFNLIQEKKLTEMGGYKFDVNAKIASELSPYDITAGSMSLDDATKIYNKIDKKIPLWLEGMIEEQYRKYNPHEIPLNIYIEREIRRHGGKDKLDEQTKQTIALNAIDYHNDYVESAIAQGKSIPTEVLKDYPEIKPIKKPEMPKEVLGEFGINNKIFTKEKADEAWKRLTGKVFSITNPSMYEDGLLMVGYYVEGGIYKFSDVVKKFSDNMSIMDFNKFKPYLKEWYNIVRNKIPIEIASKMDSESEVQKVKVEYAPTIREVKEEVPPKERPEKKEKPPREVKEEEPPPPKEEKEEKPPLEKGKIPAGFGVSRLFARVKGALNMAMEDNPLYEKINIDRDTKEAIKFMENHAAKSHMITLGYEKSEQGPSFDVAIAFAYIEQARRNNNRETAANGLRSLTLRLSKFGQAIVSARGKFGVNSAYTFVKEVIRDRTQKAKPKGQTVGEFNETVRERAKKLRKNINKEAAKKQSFKDFLKQILCK